MAMQARGLGKGLDALLKNVDSSSSSKDIESDVKEIPIGSIIPNPEQPRKEFSEESLQELADSISTQGVLQPILVRPNKKSTDAEYELIAGERRWRASKKAGLKVIPALVKDISDEDSLTLAMIENLQREDLNAIDEARGLYQLQQRLGLSQDALAKKIGKSRPAIANSLRLLQLPDAIQDDVIQQKISAGHARSILALDSPEVQNQLRDRILNNDLSVRETESQVSFWKQNGLLPEAHEMPLPKKNKPQKSAPIEVDQELLEIEDKIKAELQLPVSMKGKLEKGKIVIPFSSEQDLYFVLNKLGIDS